MKSPSLDRSTLVLVAFSVSMSVVSQLMMRAAMSSLSEVAGLDLLLQAIAVPQLWLALVLYGLGSVSWLAVLSRIDLAVAYPLGSSNYVLVTILSATILHEIVGPLRWAGTMAILCGILLIARGEHVHDRRTEVAS